MQDLLLQLSDEEMVEQGYLVIQRRGLFTTFIPTVKYRLTLQPAAPPTLVETQHGYYIDDPEVVEDSLYWCGECGEDYLLCQCPSDAIPCHPAREVRLLTAAPARGRYAYICSDQEE